MAVRVKPKEVFYALSVHRALEEAESQLEAVYNEARVTKGGKSYAIEPELTEVMSTSRDYDELLWAWRGWRDAIGPKAKPFFTQVVTMRNLVARKNGRWRCSATRRHFRFIRKILI